METDAFPKTTSVSMVEVIVVVIDVVSDSEYETVFETVSVIEPA
jgi:hypothetical protein